MSETTPEPTTVKDEYASVLTQTLIERGMNTHAAEVMAIEQVRQLEYFGLMPIIRVYKRGGVKVEEPADEFDLSEPTNERSTETFPDPPNDLLEHEHVLVQFSTEWMNR